jgi:cellobiose-specific phosphotransferase system component IIB
MAVSRFCSLGTSSSLLTPYLYQDARQQNKSKIINDLQKVTNCYAAIWVINHPHLLSIMGE